MSTADRRWTIALMLLLAFAVLLIIFRTRDIAELRRRLEHIDEEMADQKKAVYQLDKETSEIRRTR